MDEEKRKAKVEYNAERTRQLRKDKIIKTISCTLPYEEVEEMNIFLKKNNLNKVDLIRAGYKALKEKKK